MWIMVITCNHCVSLTGRQVSTDSRSSFPLVQTAVDERERIERLQERESQYLKSAQCPGQMFLQYLLCFPGRGRAEGVGAVVVPLEAAVQVLG